MKIWLNSYKIIISLAVSALLAPFLWNCMDYDSDYERFWLLDPSISNQRALLPFTYTVNRYYDNGLLPDTTYQAENDLAWQGMLGDNTAKKDIHQILYYTSPDDYFNKKYAKSNRFMQSLRTPNHARYLQYLNFAKTCEKIFTGDDWNEKKAGIDLKIPIQQGQSILQKHAEETALTRRAAYLLMKLYRYADQQPEAKALFDTYFRKNPTKDWLNAAAIYQYAEMEPDSVQANVWLARAWDAGFYERIWVWHSFNSKALNASVNAAVTGREKAILTLLPATREPGPALAALQKVYAFDPTTPELSKLMAREVNKLENWLLSPALYGASSRIEIPHGDDSPKIDTVALLKSDLEHLHACRNFVQQVIQDGKRTDAAFWYLSGAHLAYLDKDFGKAGELAQQGQQVANAPNNQQTQLQIIAILAEIGVSKQIAPATENKIPGLFKAIRKNPDAFETPVALEQKLALLLSEVFIQHQETAKGAFLLGLTSSYSEGMGYMNASVLFDKLLAIGQPADFDRAIQMAERPQTDFERWFAETPYRYTTELAWNEKTQSMEPADGQPASWEVHKIREFKAMWYTRKDQLDNALLALKDVPDTYWPRRGTIVDYDHIYFKINPFSVGIGITDVPLSQPDTTGKFNKRTLLEKLIDLKKTTDPAKQQEAYFLLGNGYYNMTYYGSDWWLMMDVGKSTGTLEYLDGRETGMLPDHRQPWKMLSTWSLFGFMTVAFAGFARKKQRRYLLFCLLLPLCLPFACKKATSTAATLQPSTPFNEVYYRCTLAKDWYEKAAKLHPDNDLGIAAAYMAGVCERHQQYFAFTRTRKNWDDPFVPKANPYYDAIKGKNFTSPVSCSYLQQKLK